jgi:hypothetical protein
MDDNLTVHTGIEFPAGTIVVTTIVEDTDKITVTKELYTKALAEKGSRSGVCFEIVRSDVADIECAVTNALKQTTRRVHERINKGDV